MPPNAGTPVVPVRALRTSTWRGRMGTEACKQRLRRHRCSAFDETYAAAWTSPPLTTVHQSLQEMGRAAVRTSRNMAAGTTPDIDHVELATHLVVRSTTCPTPLAPALK